jgi:hypothetical protein
MADIPSPPVGKRARVTLSLRRREREETTRASSAATYEQGSSDRD